VPEHVARRQPTLPHRPPLPEATLPEPTGAGDAPPWLEPYPDVLLDHLVDQRPGPEARYETTEAISLAFITALQLLPPRQRAALVLRDVLGYHAAEVAEMLGTTQESVQSALKRARATVDNHLANSSSTGSTGSGSNGTGSHRPARQPDTAAEHRLVARFTDALGRAYLDALIELLVTDVRLSMPPAMLEYRGIESAQRIYAAVTFRPAAPTAWYPPAPTASPPSACTWQTPTPVSTAPTASWSSPPPATTSPPSPASAPTS
jgi:Sigma-70, region 4